MMKNRTQRAMQLKETVDQMRGLLNQVDEVQPGEIEMDNPIKVISNFYRDFNNICRLPEYAGINKLLDLFKQPFVFYSKMLLLYENAIDDDEKEKIIELLLPIKKIIVTQCYRILFEELTLNFDEIKALCPDFEAYAMANCDDMFIMRIVFSRASSQHIPSDVCKRMLARKKCHDTRDSQFDDYYSPYKNENIWRLLGGIHESLDLHNASNIFATCSYLNNEDNEEKNEIIAAIIKKTDEIILSDSDDATKINDLKKLSESIKNIIPAVGHELIYSNVKTISSAWKEIRSSIVKDIKGAIETNDLSYKIKVSSLQDVSDLDRRAVKHLGNVFFPTNSRSTARYEAMNAWLRSQHEQLLGEACAQCLIGDITDSRADFTNFISFLTKLDAIYGLYINQERTLNTVETMVRDRMSINANWRDINTKFPGDEQEMVKKIRDELQKLNFPQKLEEAKLTLYTFILGRVSECLMRRQDLSTELNDILRQISFYKEIIDVFKVNQDEPEKYEVKEYVFLDSTDIKKMMVIKAALHQENSYNFKTNLYGIYNDPSDSARPLYPKERQNLYLRFQNWLKSQLGNSPIDEVFVATAKEMLSKTNERLVFLDELTKHDNTFILSDECCEAFKAKHIQTITFPLIPFSEFQESVQRDYARLLSLGRMQYLIKRNFLSDTNNFMRAEIKTILSIGTQVAEIIKVFHDDKKIDERAKQLVSMLEELPAVKNVTERRANSRFFENGIPPDDFVLYRLKQLAVAIADSCHVKTESNQAGMQ